MVNFRKEIGVDWLSITGPGSCVPELVELLESLEARSDWNGAGPGAQYADRWFLPSGAKLFTGRTGSDRFHLELPGSACATFGAEAVHAVGQRAMMGGRCTRLDLRLDFHGERLTLLDDLMASVDARQMCKVRQQSRFVQRDALGAVTGCGQYLGSLQSPRFVRVYDKGLEQGTHPAATWIRWEAELKEEFATLAACDVFSAGLDDLTVTALPHVFDLVDFRIGLGTDPNVHRLARPAWWSELLRDVAEADAKIPPREVSFDAWAEALRHQYGRVLVACAKRAGVSVGEFAEFVLDGARPSVATHRNPVLPAAVAAFQASRGRLRSRS